MNISNLNGQETAGTSFEKRLNRFQPNTKRNSKLTVRQMKGP